MDLEVAEIPNPPRRLPCLKDDLAEDRRSDAHDPRAVEPGVERGLPQAIEERPIVRPVVDLESILAQGIGREGLEPGDSLLVLRAVAVSDPNQSHSEE